MSENFRVSECGKKDLLKLPPLTLYEVATDIQVSDKWKIFAFAVGFSTENIIMIEMSNSGRFPAENVMYHWFSKNPKVDDLAKVLCDLDLEKPLYRLKNHMSLEAFKKIEQKLKKNRLLFNNQDNDLLTYEESNEIDVPDSKINYQTQLSNNSSTSTSIPTTPEPGLVSIPRCMLSESPKKELSIITKNEPNISESSIFEDILDRKSTKYSVDEFHEDFFEIPIQGKFGGEFFKKLRGNNFYVQSFCLQKLSESKKDQRRLFNNIWAITNFRLYSLPIITGYCFYENYLFLIYPDCQTKSLFDILHRPEKNNNVIISLKERLSILLAVGEVLSFLHCSIPFGACHGNVISENVFIGPNVILLSGFDKFYTEDPQYLNGFSQISKNKIFKTKIKIEDFYQRDIKNYLELICETFWNIPNKKTQSGDSLIDDIKGNTIISKVRYLGWGENIEIVIQNIIRKFTTVTKEHPKIEEIIDELFVADKSSAEPPSYNEIEQIEITKTFK